MQKLSVSSESSSICLADWLGSGGACAPISLIPER
jgi:hypothetical protein